MTDYSDTTKPHGEKNPDAPSILVLYHQISQEDISGIRQIFSDTNWELAYGPPTAWFNLGTHFSQYDLDEESKTIWEIGLKEHPGAIDLLCALLQLAYGVFDDLDSAARVWTLLERRPERHRYWRYFAYGANYFARAGLPGAQEHIMKGFDTVRGSNLSDLYSALSGLGSLESFNTDANAKVDEILRRGLRLQMPLAHRIALMLCVRTQRRVSTVDGTEERTRLLTEAFDYAKLAGHLYVDVVQRGNHPLEEVWFHQARVLVSLGRYGEALPLLRTIEGSGDRIRQTKNWFTSVKPMRIFCEQMTGLGASVDLEAALTASSSEDVANLARIDHSIYEKLMRAAVSIQKEMQRE